MVTYPSVFNAPSLQLSTVYVPVSLWGDGVVVHPEKVYPKVGDNISIHHLVLTFPQHKNVYCVQNLNYK